RSVHLHSASLHVGRGIRRINPERISFMQMNLPQLFLFELALLIANAQTGISFKEKPVALLYFPAKKLLYKINKKII
ncbi:MAG: hypothetical protein J6A75_08365, partial [Lachnospiraceae bacterium]|nr:hypothetical protein [Lachnospiraceae bacterium]